MREFRIVLLAAVLLSLLPASAPTLQAQADSSGNAAFSSISLYPNIETSGVVIAGTSLPATAQLLYQAAGETTWRTGHPLTRIDDGRLVGSLFGLAPSTTYQVKVVDDAAEITSSFTTQPEELSFTPLVSLHVNANALPGGDGSAAAPYRTIQEAVNRAGPGTQVRRFFRAGQLEQRGFYPQQPGHGLVLDCIGPCRIAIHQPDRRDRIPFALPTWR